MTYLLDFHLLVLAAMLHVDGGAIKALSANALNFNNDNGDKEKDSSDDDVMECEPPEEVRRYQFYNTCDGRVNHWFNHKHFEKEDSEIWPWGEFHHIRFRNHHGWLLKTNELKYRRDFPLSPELDQAWRIVPEDVLEATDDYDQAINDEIKKAKVHVRLSFFLFLSLWVSFFHPFLSLICLPVLGFEQGDRWEPQNKFYDLLLFFT